MLGVGNVLAVCILGEREEEGRCTRVQRYVCYRVHVHVRVPEVKVGVIFNGQRNAPDTGGEEREREREQQRVDSTVLETSCGRVEEGAEERGHCCVVWWRVCVCLVVCLFCFVFVCLVGGESGSGGGGIVGWIDP